MERLEQRSWDAQPVQLREPAREQGIQWWFAIPAGRRCWGRQLTAHLHEAQVREGLVKPAGGLKPKIHVSF